MGGLVLGEGGTGESTEGSDVEGRIDETDADSVEEVAPLLKPLPWNDEDQKTPQEPPAHVRDLAWTIVLPLWLKLCGDACHEVRHEAGRSAVHILRAAAPEL